MIECCWTGEKKKSIISMVTGCIRKSISSGIREGIVLLNQELSDRWTIWNWSGSTTLNVWNPSDTEPEPMRTAQSQVL